ncbi:hypothetical protein CLM71_02565 [Serratia sp. MYb239]|nr:hypothetical protein CLM71_02565 [Serratia sp. MYb239]
MPPAYPRRRPFGVTAAPDRGRCGPPRVWFSPAVHQSRRGSPPAPAAGFLFGKLQRRRPEFPPLWGVWHDAKYIADHIATQRSYLSYKDAGQRR